MDWRVSGCWCTSFGIQVSSGKWSISKKKLSTHTFTTFSGGEKTGRVKIDVKSNIENYIQSTRVLPDNKQKNIFVHASFFYDNLLHRCVEAGMLIINLSSIC